MSQHKHSFHLLSGLSGTGKTTLGKYIATKNKMIMIDQDTFYKKTKPKVVLSSGLIVSNWDCLEAIDWDALCTAVLKELTTNSVILVGFALWQSELARLIEYVDSHVLLIYGSDEVNRCKKARLHKGVDAVRDSLVVDELVMPFYRETLKNLGDCEVIKSFENERRRSIEELYNEWGIVTGLG